MLSLLAVALVCLTTLAASPAKLIEAVGVGETEEAAVMEALRNAILKAGFLDVSASQKLVDGNLTYDETSVKARAYVDSYQVLRRGKDPKTKLEKVRIKARVLKYSQRMKNVTPPVEMVRCPTCKGEGRRRFNSICGKCGGAGTLPDILKRGIGHHTYVHRGGVCPKCKGKGVEEQSEICKECKGTRYVRADDLIEVSDGGGR